MSGKIHEIKLSPNMSEHDMSYRVKWAEKWIKDKDQIKITMVFKGRQMRFRDIGYLTLYKFLDKLASFALPIHQLKDAGRQIVCIVKSKS